jgi:hypothetical protein
LQVEQPYVAVLFPRGDELPGDGAHTGAVEKRHAGKVEEDPLAALPDERVHDVDERRYAVFEDEPVVEIEDHDIADFALLDTHVRDCSRAARNRPPRPCP